MATPTKPNSRLGTYVVKTFKEVLLSILFILHALLILAKDRYAHRHLLWHSVWKEGERKKLKSAENETRAPRPRAGQIGCAGQFAIPEVIVDAWEVPDFARNYFGSMTLSPLI